MHNYVMSQPGDNCFLFAAANLLQLTPDYLIQEIGHNGKAVIWPEEPPPLCLRGYAFREIQELFWKRGLTLHIIEYEPKVSCNESHQKTLEIYNQETAHARFDEWIRKTRGILIHMVRNIQHAVSYERIMIHDPRSGRKYLYHEKPDRIVMALAITKLTYFD